jgi:diguanylate cyclase (GGDEF)-like protein
MPDEAFSRIRQALVALLAVAASGYVAFFWSRQEGIRALQTEARNQLVYSTAALFAPTDKYSYLPEVVAGHPLIVSLMQGKRDPRRVQEANLFLERLNAGVKSSVIYVLDDKGLVLASSNWNGPQPFIGMNYAFRPYFQDAMTGRTGRFYGMGTTSTLPGYYISHPILLGNAILGVIVVKIELSNLDQGWRDSRDEIVVTDENGVIFLSSHPDWKYRPMRPLTPETEAQLKRTRQYDQVLKEPLRIDVVSELQPDEKIVIIRQTEQDATYFLKTGMLDKSGWAINVMVPMSDVNLHALRLAVITSGALALTALSILYLQQMRVRNRERDRSRLALEQAHQALEQKHRELQKLSEELRLTSITDPLTGAYNRRFFFESVPKIVSAANRHHFPFSIVTVDVDHFKSINDMYGHPTGDDVLRTLTQLCRESLREADVFARFGGEEFIMALPNTSADVATVVAERLRLRVSEHPLEIKGEHIYMTVSCGVSQYIEGESSVEQAIRRADEALYAAKREGRNRVVVR